MRLTLTSTMNLLVERASWTWSGDDSARALVADRATRVLGQRIVAARVLDATRGTMHRKLSVKAWTLTYMCVRTAAPYEVSILPYPDAIHVPEEHGLGVTLAGGGPGWLGCDPVRAVPIPKIATRQPEKRHLVATLLRAVIGVVCSIQETDPRAD